MPEHKFVALLHTFLWHSRIKIHVEFFAKLHKSIAKDTAAVSSGRGVAAQRMRRWHDSLANMGGWHRSTNAQHLDLFSLSPPWLKKASLGMRLSVPRRYA